MLLNYFDKICFTEHARFFIFCTHLSFLSVLTTINEEATCCLFNLYSIIEKLVC